MIHKGNNDQISCLYRRLFFEQKNQRLAVKLLRLCQVLANSKLPKRK